MLPDELRPTWMSYVEVMQEIWEDQISKSKNKFQGAISQYSFMPVYLL